MTRSFVAASLLALLLAINVKAQTKSPLQKEVDQFSWGLYEEVKQLPVALDRLTIYDTLTMTRVPIIGKINHFLHQHADAFYKSRLQSLEAVKGNIPEARGYQPLGSLGMEDILSGFIMEDSTLNPVYALKTSIDAGTLANNMATTLFIMLDENNQTRTDKLRLYGAYVFSGLRLTAQQVSGDTWRIWADGQWRVLDLTWDIRKNKVWGVKVWTKG
ncbi:hypothetical protein MKQ68_07330 [Chitinophaga horti]|uniref:Nuclear transport factor 2 family protein n=1 Tax=Chitinophaga horti TaxID=2920382 RepID=A0ABY6J5L5_9BACT|nr:hypothetical protein [Chitinophaga horti]UYQ94903.1 hypothetical protein MKQ68_07330 [Chitinophaga horti]